MIILIAVIGRRYIEEKRSKERQPARLPPKKSACLRQAEPPAASLQDVDNEEQLLRQELADLYAARNKLLWLLRRATEVEIHRNHDPSRYSSTAGSGSGGNRR